MRTVTSTIREVLVISSLVWCFQSSDRHAFAANPGDIDLGPIAIAPARLLPGQYPNIETRVDRVQSGSGKYVEVNIIAIVTQPDHRVRSWNWKKVKISRDAARTITVPKEYDTSVTGTYRVEIVAYSEDMKRRLATRTGTFEVADWSKSPQQGGKQLSVMKEDALHATTRDKQRYPYASIGLYGNTLNPAGGGTIFVWPSKYVGMQGSITTGEFISYEGRLLARIERAGGQGLYGGIGFIHVKKIEDIIGVGTKFEDSSVSGVVGLEVPLGKKILLCLEVIATGIELKETVTNGAQTVQASVKYAPVTVGIGLVMRVF